MSPWKTSNLLNDEIKDEGFDTAHEKAADPSTD